MLLDLAAVTIENPVVPDLCPINSEGFGGFDVAAVYGNAEIPVDIRLAATAAREPAVASYWRLDYDCRLAVDRNVRCINLQNS